MTTTSSDEFAQLWQEMNLSREKIIALEEELLRRQQTNLKLSKENLTLVREYSALSKEKSEWCENQQKLNQDLETAKERIFQLENEVSDVKELMTAHAPLVQVGVAVRWGFWEQAKEARGGGVANEAIVAAAKKAAQEGNALADATLFDLGLMDELLSSNYYPVVEHSAAFSETELSCAESSAIDLSEMDDSVQDSKHSSANSSAASSSDTEFRTKCMESFYKVLYTVDLCSAKSIQENFSARGIELLNLSATMTSCSPNYWAGLEDSDSADHDRFNALAEGCVKRYMEDESFSTFENDPEVGKNLHEMREIVARALRQSRGTPTEDGI